MAVQDVQRRFHALVPVGDFKFTIDADRATGRDLLVAGCAVTVSLSAVYGIYKSITSKRQAFNTAVNKGLGGDRDDQQMGGIELGSLQVSLHCFTDERFLEVLQEYKSGRIKERLEKAFSDIGIETEGLVVGIENIGVVVEKAEAILMRQTAPQIIVQGGAYRQRLWHDIKESDFMEIVKRSAKEGYEVLTVGGTAVDAVEAAVRVLEDSEYFNAGYGSFLSCEGEVECDATIMDGDTLNSGSVTSGRHFHNPISLAKLIMNDSYHCALSGEGALKFAEEKRFPVFYDKKELITQRSKNLQVSHEDFIKNVNCRMRGVLVGETDVESCCENDDSGDTVSAVARDANGRFACAVSTGGVAGKLKGRVSDASMVGCGGYANRHGAATTSGLGESIIKMTLAREVVYLMEGGRNAQESAKESLNKMRSRANDVGGVIAIDQDGNFGKAFSTKVMGWASIKENTMQFGLRRNEVEEETL